MKGVSQIVGAVLLIAITVIAAIALYFMINNQQTSTNVQFGNLQLSSCVYTYDTSSNNSTVTLTFKYLGSQPINGVNATLYNIESTEISHNDTYVTTSNLEPGKTQQLRFTVENANTKLVDGTTGNLNKAPLTVEFSGNSANIPSLKIDSCRKVVA
jgi:flagellin-like protein